MDPCFNLSQNLKDISFNQFILDSVHIVKFLFDVSDWFGQSTLGGLSYASGVWGSGCREAYRLL